MFLKCLGLGYSDETVGYVGVKLGDCEIAGFGGSEYQITVLWGIMPCGLADSYHRFKGTY
jgi:hypothetical protein